MANSGGFGGSRPQSASAPLFLIPEPERRFLPDCSPSFVCRSHHRLAHPPGLRSPLRYRGCAHGPSRRLWCSGCTGNP
ncbi:hypothetical protein BDA96_01G234500 [Sorghum bicolor]|uniref:Uncharacterized protein n=2 Tax=Sorghum bicolor TaxID=4558 RepID=A0A921S0D2_SORBI|nr:hypothetical protein BDA96_01G234500 [Sorghum bicolor]OQU91637.1 hypothetical protein SORBI_3001G220132 [Sorghum bicolor]